nr:AraC family transcriptional regulator N-terminal domain-containing protein [uncultured Albidiferax sp.]
MIAQHCYERRTAIAIPRVGLMRSDTPTLPMGVVYQPMLYVVAQGAKQALLGDTIVEYAAGQYVLVSVDLPITGAVTQASPDAPYLALSLQLDPAVLADMLLTLPTAAQADAASIGFAVGYESPSQFSREYPRMYGQPPLRDAARLRTQGPLVEV